MFPITNGQNIFALPAGFPNIDVKEVNLQNQGARLKSPKELDNLVKNALEESDYRVVVVHMVTGSKTGYTEPSPCVLKGLPSCLWSMPANGDCRGGPAKPAQSPFRLPHDRQ